MLKNQTLPQEQAPPTNGEARSFIVHHATKGNVEILSLCGRMHDLQFPILEDVLMRLLRQHSSRVILECPRLVSASSVTLLRLLTYVRSFRDKGGDMKLAVLPPSIAGLARVLDLETKIECHPSVASAIDAMPGTALGKSHPYGKGN